MKNLHILPTPKPSRLHYYYYFDGQPVYGLSTTNLSWRNGRHIYITSDEEIKEGDWGLSKLNEIIKFHSGYDYRYYSKIILTTDQDLDGVQAIDDEFLKWFVNNPSCEEIQTIRVSTWCNGGKVCVCNVPKFCNEKRNDFKYKIIIPTDEYKQESVFENAKSSLKKYLFDNKEKVAKDLEQMREWSNTDKQDPLEQAAKEYAEMHLDVSGNLGKYLVKAVFQDGAQWQQERSYNEANKIIEFLDNEAKLKISDTKTIERVKWYLQTYFEQFKKK